MPFANIDGAQAVYSFSYDPRGNLLQEVGPTATVSRTHDELGRLLTSTDGDRFTTTLIRDPLGNVTDQKGPHLQEHWTFSYDPFNQVLTKSIDAAGTTPAASWSFLYNVSGVTVQETGPLAIVQRTLNARSKLLKEERTPLDSSPGVVTVFSYDGPWAKEQKTADGSWHDNHSWSFDDRGRPTSSLEHWDADPLGYDYSTSTQWTGRSASVSELAKIGTRTESRSSTLAVDSLGNLIARTQANTTDFWTYDAAGLLSKLSPSGKPETLYSYSQGLLSSSAFGSETTSYAYFPDRRAKSISEPSGRTRSFQWNARGLLSKETYGSEVTDFTYDGGGFLSSKTLASGTSDQAIWSYDHGPRGELRSVSQPSSLGDFTYGYNAAALLVSIQPPSGGMPPQTFQYDYLGRQIQRTRGSGAIWSTSWSNGEATTISPNGPGLVVPDGDSTKTLLDPRGRVARQIFVAGTKSSGNLTATFSYDPLDQLLDISEFPGSPTSFSYDGRSRLLSVNRTGLGQASYTYTSSGELETVSSPTSSLTYGYDSLDRVSSLTSLRGTSSVSWEPGGQHLASLSDTLLFERRCYDSSGRVSEVLNSKGSVLCGDRSASILSGFSYSYDRRGNRLSETAFFAGSQSGLTSYGYDKADRLTGVNYGQNATLYRLSGDGTRTNEKLLTGYSGVLDDSGYANSPDGTRWTYNYNPRGALQTISEAGSATPVASFTSDETGRILSETRGDTSKSYTWSANGRLASASVRMPDASTTPPGTKTVSVTYQYDARGLRIGKTGPAGSAKYLWGASELVEEQLPGSTLFYERLGDTVARLGVERVMHDGLGSVVGRIGSSTTKYRFDAWGNYLTAAPGNTAPSAGYGGQHWDDELGISYAQQRWYDPRVGRFLSEDPVFGDPRNPTSLHPFGYGVSNPLIYTDPRGEIAPLVILGIIALGGELGFFGSIIHQEVTERKDITTVSYKKAGVSAAIGAGAAGAAVATGGGALALTGAAGIGGAGGSVAVAATVGGATSAYTGTTLSGLSQGMSFNQASERGAIAAPFGAAAGFLGSGVAPTTSSLAASAGMSQPAANAVGNFTAGVAADQLYQRGMVATGQQKDVSWAQSFAVGGFAVGVSAALPQNTSPPRGRVSGDPGIMLQKAHQAASGDSAAAAELRVAKMLREEGSDIYFLDDKLQQGTYDFKVRTGSATVNTDVKRIGGLGRNAAGDLAKGAQQVGPGGQVIVVRPASARQSLSAYKDFVGGFKPKQPGVTIRVVDEASLPPVRGATEQ